MEYFEISLVYVVRLLEKIHSRLLLQSLPRIIVFSWIQFLDHNLESTGLSGFHRIRLQHQHQHDGIFGRLSRSWLSNAKIRFVHARHEYYTFPFSHLKQICFYTHFSEKTFLFFRNRWDAFSQQFYINKIVLSSTDNCINIFYIFFCIWKRKGLHNQNSSTNQRIFLSQETFVSSHIE